MSKVPFEKFIITFLLFNKDIRFIIDKLNTFGYNVDEDEVSEIFSEVKRLLPKDLSKHIANRQPLDIEDKHHVQWLKQFDIFEFYDFIIRRDQKLKKVPSYFKQCEDCLWIHSNEDIMSLINIFLFNGEDHESISKIVNFKYKKTISLKTLDLYNRVFWETKDITAKEALFHCIPFRNNALIIRRLRNGDLKFGVVDQTTEVEANEGDESNDGCDISFTFHNSEYIKWKIGYKDVTIPSTEDFLEKVKTDSFYKYYETMNMTQSIEIEKEDGNSLKLGAFDVKKTKRRNVEEQRVKMAKYWLDMYLKADKSKPIGRSSKEDFFEKMANLELNYEEDDKIALIDDVPEVMKDIKGDISSATI